MDVSPAPAATGPAELTDCAAKIKDSPIQSEQQHQEKEEAVLNEKSASAGTEDKKHAEKNEPENEDSEPLTIEQAQEKMLEGKRHMKCQEYEKAAECFSSASEAFARTYGDQAIECGDVFYYYGDALLQLASTEQTLIGGGAEQDDDEDGDGVDGDGDGAPADDGEDGEGLVDGNMQLAWEALEVARVIFAAAGPGRTDELAQVYMKLGEHGQMREDYKQALEDLHESLRLRETIAQPNDRELAEIRYLLGLCYMHDKQYKEAQTMYRQARDILKANAQEHPEVAGDLAEVIADLAEKIDECRELEQEKARAEQDTKAMLLGAMHDAMASFGQGAGAQNPFAAANAGPATNPFAAANAGAAANPFAAANAGAASAPTAGSAPVARDLGSLVRKRKAPANEDEADDKREKAETSEHEPMKPADA